MTLFTTEPILILKIGYNMTALAMNYVVNPFGNLGKSLFRTFEIIGYARAAGELQRLGYLEEAKNCAAMRDSLRAKN